MLKDTMNYDEPISTTKKKKGRINLEHVLATVTGTTDRKIVIEFECGECCKKVLNGENINIIGNFIVLTPAANKKLMLKLFSGGALVERQRLDLIIIPIDRICSLEFGAEELDGYVNS